MSVNLLNSDPLSIDSKLLSETTEVMSDDLALDIWTLDSTLLDLEIESELLLSLLLESELLDELSSEELSTLDFEP